MFLDKMPNVQSAKQVTIMRAKPGKPIQGLVTGSLIRVMTHWYKGKTLPCLLDSLNKCPLCKIGIAKRYYAYYSLRGAKGGAAMLELTATAEAELMDYAKQCPAGSVLLVTASRAPGKKNNPIHVSVEFRDCSAENMIAINKADLDKDIMKRSLTRLWNLPEWGLGMREDVYVEIVSSHIQEVIDGNV